MKDIQKFIGKADYTISMAMSAIDTNSNGILFLVDQNGVISGCITDGDIRRFLLSGGGLEDQVTKAINKNPKLATSEAEAKALYHSKNYRIIPIVDKQKRIIDVYTGIRKESDSKKSLHIPVVINAGGRGTRLDPYTRVLPKPLIPVGELPIIELIMREYLRYECDEFHIIVNYKKELMKAYFAENENCYNVTWYDEEKPLGTGGGLSLLKGKFQETFFFANCDALLTADYEKIIDYHKSNNNDITMICANKNLTLPYGVVEVDSDGVIKEIKEKPLMTFHTNTGIYIVEPGIVEDIEANVAIGFPDIIEKERKKGRKVAAYSVNEDDWMDMGQISELEKMRVKLYGE